MEDNNIGTASLNNKDLLKKIAELHGTVYVLLEEVVQLKSNLTNENQTKIIADIQQRIDKKANDYLISLIQ